MPSQSWCTEPSFVLLVQCVAGSYRIIQIYDQTASLRFRKQRILRSGPADENIGEDFVRKESP